MEELLSIIVLSYKNGEFLFETLDSILQQNYPNIEIIICDDASPDFTKEKIEDYLLHKKGKNVSNTVILVNHQNLGTVKNLNQGIQISKGTYIKAIAGDDTLSSADVCTLQVEYLRKRSNVALVVGNTIECDDKLNPLSMSGFQFDNTHDLLLQDRTKLLRYVIRINQKALATQAICFRKSFFDKHGLYDESFLLVEDLPMAVRIIESGVQIGYINIPCVNHRGQVGISTSNLVFDIRKLKYYKDLDRYYSSCLIPIENKIGRTYVRMRHGIIRFRIEYCELDGSTKFTKLKTIIKHLPHIVYYVITKWERVLFYLKK